MPQAIDGIAHQNFPNLLSGIHTIVFLRFATELGVRQLGLASIFPNANRKTRAGGGSESMPSSSSSVMVGSSAGRPSARSRASSSSATTASAFACRPDGSRFKARENPQSDRSSAAEASGLIPGDTLLRVDGGMLGLEFIRQKCHD